MVVVGGVLRRREESEAFGGRGFIRGMRVDGHSFVPGNACLDFAGFPVSKMDV